MKKKAIGAILLMILLSATGCRAEERSEATMVKTNAQTNIYSESACTIISGVI